MLHELHGPPVAAASTQSHSRIPERAQVSATALVAAIYQQKTPDFQPYSVDGIIGFAYTTETDTHAPSWILLRRRAATHAARCHLKPQRRAAMHTLCVCRPSSLCRH